MSWLLIALSFLLGIAITVALVIRPIKSKARAKDSGRRPGVKKAVGSVDAPTEKFPVVDDGATRKIGAAKKVPAKKVPVKKARPVKGAATRQIPVGAGDAPTKKVRVVKKVARRRIPVDAERRTENIPVAKESPTMKVPGMPFAPFGPGSARATADGGGPAGWLIKGRSDTRLFYTPDDPTYEPVVAQVWFRDEGSAKRAFFTPWRDSSNNSG